MARRASAQISADNPWDYVLAIHSRASVQHSLAHSGAQLLRLLHRLQKIRRGQVRDAWSGIYGWAHALPPAPASAPTAAGGCAQGQGQAQAQAQAQAQPQGLAPADALRREIVLAHAMTMQVRCEAARGRHGGAQRGDRRADGDRRARQVALCARALNDRCAGVLLNLLLDWPTGAQLVSAGFLDRVCAQLLQPEQLQQALEAARDAYRDISGGGAPGAGFMGALWAAPDSLALARRALEQIIHGQRGAADAAADAAIRALCLRLMQCARKSGRPPAEIAAVYALGRRWVHAEARAHNIMMHGDAQACNAAG
ncbi:hypothetical protein GGF37_007463, partial [Kickxella alabastrina]